MEGEIAAASRQETNIHDGLKFELPTTGSYVLERSNTSLFCSGGNSYSPNGVRTLVFNIGSLRQWLDGPTTRLAFTVTNSSGTLPLQPISPNPLICFSRMRLLSAGVVLEDISLYNRTSETLRHLQGADRQAMDAAEGFGRVFNAASHNMSETVAAEPIPANSSRRVMTHVLSGILNQPKWLCLMWMPLQLEFELAGFADWTDRGTISPTAATGSQDWVISDARLLCDLCTIDPEMQNEFTDFLRQGGLLPIPYASFVTQQSAVADANPTVILARGFTRLKSVLATLFHSSADSGRLQANFLYNPHGLVAYTVASDTNQFSLQIGAKRWPDTPMRGFAEMYYRLRLAVGKYFSDAALSVTPQEYRDDKFIVGFDLEKAACHGCWGGGVSTRGGELLTLDCGGLGAGGDIPTAIFITLHYDSVIHVRMDASPSVLD